MENETVLENSTKLAIKEAREEFKDLAKELGLDTDEDLINLVKEIRYQMVKNKSDSNNAN